MSEHNNEIDIFYPVVWEDEYRQTKTVASWHEKFPELFNFVEFTYGYSTRPGTLDLFAQHALMYLLRRDEGFMSITWYSLAETSEKTKNRRRTLDSWSVMKKWMGEAAFSNLQSSLLDNGFKDFTGEPDLFCWHPESGKWFFAEAKGKDKLLESQEKWFEIYRATLPDGPPIRVYRLRPE